MPQFCVHLFAVIRVLVPPIEAESHEQAVQLARESETAAGLTERFQAADCEFAEEFSSFLVDVVGDGDYRRSQWFESRDNLLATPLQTLVDWADGDRDPAVLDRLVQSARELVAVTV